MAATSFNNGPMLPSAPFQGPAALPMATSGGELLDSINRTSLLDQRIALFGNNNRNFNQDDYAGMDLENRILPDDWKRIAEKHISKVIIQKIDADYEFFVNVLLPWTDYAGGNVVKMSRIIFNPHMLDEVPEQGVVRFVTNNYEEWHSSVARQGIGFLMENGFAMTPTGLLHYAMSVEQIKNATISTACTQAIYTILNTKAPTNWYETYGIPPSKQQLKSLFEYETRMWAILSKENGFSNLQDMAREILSYRQVKPDYLLISEGMVRDYKNNPLHQREMDFLVAGPQGPQERRGDGPIPALTKYKLFEVRKFQIGEHSMPTDLLESVRSIGDMAIFSHEGHKGINGEEYTSALMNPTILNHEGNRMQELSHRDHIEYSCLFLPNGQLSDAVGLPFFRGKAKRHGTFGEFLENTGSNVATKFWETVKHQCHFNGKLGPLSKPENQKLFGPEVIENVARLMRKKNKKAGKSVENASITDKKVSAAITPVLENLLGSLHGSIPTAASSNSYESILAERGDPTFNAPRWFKDVLQNYSEHLENTTELGKWLEKYVSVENAWDATKNNFALYSLSTMPVDIRAPFFVWLFSDRVKGEELQLVLQNVQQECNEKTPSWFTNAGVTALTEHHVVDPEAVDILTDLVNGKSVDLDDFGRARPKSGVREKPKPKAKRSSRSKPTADEEEEEADEPISIPVMPELDASALFKSTDTGAGTSQAGFTTALHRRVNEIKSSDTRHFHKTLHAELVKGWHVIRPELRQAIDHLVAMQSVIIDALPTSVLKATNVKRNIVFSAMHRITKSQVGKLKLDILKSTDKEQRQAIRLFELFNTDAMGNADFWGALLAKLGEKDPTALSDQVLLHEFEVILNKHSPMKQMSTASAAGVVPNYNEWVKAFKNYPIEAITKDFCLFLIDCDLWFPFHGLSLRPHIEWLMTTGILIKSGSETGVTYRGFPNLLLSVDGSRKMLMGHFTLHLGSVIRTPQNILLLHNIGCREYIRGGGMEHWEPYNEEHARMYSKGIIGQRAFFSVPLYAYEKIDAAFIDITGYFPANLRGNDEEEEKPHYDMAQHCAVVWGWVQEDEKTYMDLGFYERSSYRNTRVAVAHQYHYRIVDNRKDSRGHEVLGTGHWAYSYDGCVKDRCGKGEGNLLTRREPRISTLAF